MTATSRSLVAVGIAEIPVGLLEERIEPARPGQGRQIHGLGELHERMITCDVVIADRAPSSPATMKGPRAARTGASCGRPSRAGGYRR